jgi:hypothetical protein
LIDATRRGHDCTSYPVACCARPRSDRALRPPFTPPRREVTSPKLIAAPAAAAHPAEPPGRRGDIPPSNRLKLPTNGT